MLFNNGLIGPEDGLPSVAATCSYLASLMLATLFLLEIRMARSFRKEIGFRYVYQCPYLRLELLSGARN